MRILYYEITCALKVGSFLSKVAEIWICVGRGGLPGCHHPHSEKKSSEIVQRKKLCMCGDFGAMLRRDNSYLELA